MDAADRRAPRLAIGCNRADRAGELRQALHDRGIEVVAVHAIGDALLRSIGPDDVDVLLIDLDADLDGDPLLLEALVERTTLPVLFNDGTAGRTDENKWANKLAAKVRGLAAGRPGGTSIAPAVKAAPVLAPRATVSAARVPTARRLWVLGASVGGPQALKEFLRELPPDIPVGFIVVQHIGERFIIPLAKQLGRVTALRVEPALPGMSPGFGQVLIAPVGMALVIDENRELRFGKDLLATGYRPSIDTVMEQGARRFGEQCGAIVFSGMGDDGVLGCKAVVAGGGIVWAQDAGSCLISSMPDRVRAAGVVSFSGRPSALARRLAEMLSGGKDRYHEEGR
jgi:chemosensory pili system protein ChpB (putative protein-glutamate methylesterase)